MGVYKRKLKKVGVRWRFDGQYRGVRYTSPAQFKTEAQARKAERARLDEIDQELDHPRTVITFGELAELRLDYLQAATTARYYHDNRRTFSRAGEEWRFLPTGLITRQMVQEYLVGRASDLVEEGRDMYSVNKDIRHLKALFYYGMDELGVVDHDNPFRKIRFYPVKQAVKYIPPDEDISKVMLAANQFQQTYLTTLKYTLARSIELNRLQISDVDFNNSRVRLWTKKSKVQDLTPRWVKMTKDLHQCLEAWFRARDKRNPFVFYDDDGNQLTYQWWLPTLCKRADVKRFSFHAFRHRGATVLLKRGNIDIHTLMEILLATPT